MSPGQVPRWNVLLVEDDPDQVVAVRRLLQRASPDRVELVHAPTLSAAMERLDRGGVDVALLDLSLPDSSMNDTLPEVLARYPSIPVIALTSLDDLDFAREVVSQGAQDYLVKTDLSGELLLRALSYAVERKKIQVELVRSNEALKGFARTVAHEIRSPLNTVVCGLQLLQMKHAGQIDAEGGQTLQTTLRATQGMVNLVNRLLEFAQVGSQTQPREPVPAGELFDQALQDLAGAVAECDAEVSRGPLPVVVGDAVQLRRLWVNLLGNALKYRGAAPPRVEVGCQQRAGEWLFSVRDNGIGIDPEDQKKIFNIFVRLHRDQYPGTGIGLAFCKQIVESHGGRIWVESAPGQGSTFYFTLPAVG